MPLDKFTMETVDDLVFDAIEAVRGKCHKPLDKKSSVNTKMYLQKPTKKLC